MAISYLKNNFVLGGINLAKNCNEVKLFYLGIVNKTDDKLSDTVIRSA